jgi:hypothetical protein
MEESTVDLVKNSLIYYDTNYEKYSKKILKYKYISVEPNLKNNYEKDKLNFYDKDKKLMFTTEYEHLGIFDTGSHMWTWAWATPFLRKNNITLSRKILNYGFDLESDDNLFLKTELITSRFIISDDTQLDIHIAIASYISKKPAILRFIISTQEKDKTHYKIKKHFKEGDLIYYIYILNFDLI